MKSLLIALQFLTIIPVKIKDNVTEKDIARSAMFFPLVGAFQGLILSFFFIILNLFFTSTLSGGIIVLIYVLQNGGFHIDGLADTCDALSVKSTGIKAHDIKKRLEAMADSATGAIGVAAVCLDILLKYLLIRELFVSGRQFNPYLMIFLMPIFSKWAMVVSMRIGESAKPEGLGNIFLKNTKTNELYIASFITIFLSLILHYLLIIITSQFVNTTFSGHMLAMLSFVITETATIFILCYILTLLFKKKFNGLTGDSLGATHECSEFIFLLIALLWK